MRQEVSASIEAVENETGALVAFSYPDGNCNDAVVAEVSARNATCAVTTREGVVHRTSERFRLPRLFLRPES